MNVDSNYIEAGEAVITANGIAYCGRLYSCQVAVREQWFTNVSQDQEISVAIYVSSNDMEQIYLMHNDSFVPCNWIGESNDEFTESDKERYHRKMQQIKKELQQTNAEEENYTHKPQT
jgi:hypothetical protein